MKDYRIRKETRDNGMKIYWVEHLHGLDEHENGINEIWEPINDRCVFFSLEEAQKRIDKLREFKKGIKVISSEIIEY